jgi:hypothetical protein
VIDRELQVQGNGKDLGTGIFPEATDEYSGNGAEQIANIECSGIAAELDGAAWKPVGGVEGQPQRTTQHSHQSAVADMFPLG